MTLHRWATRGGLLLGIAFTCTCSSSRKPAIPEIIPARVCWTLQRTIDDVSITKDTSYIPSRFEFEVTSTGTITAPGTDIRGRWFTVQGDSVHAEWTEGRRRIWLYGAMRESRFHGSGHVFTRFGATILVSYVGIRRACETRDLPHSIIGMAPLENAQA